MPPDGQENFGFPRECEMLALQFALGNTIVDTGGEFVQAVGEVGFQVPRGPILPRLRLVGRLLEKEPGAERFAVLEAAVRHQATATFMVMNA